MSTSESTPNIEAASSLIHEALRSSPELGHVPQTKLRQFCFDLALVACEVRSAYLFDAFAFRQRRKSPQDFFLNMLKILRQKALCFSRVILVNEPWSDQLFFVNRPLLQNIYNISTENYQEVFHGITFVAVKGSHAKVSGPTHGMEALLHAVASNPPIDENEPYLVVLSAGSAPNTGELVAFAGCLLEFPIVYVPDVTGDGAFLSGVPLDVYECKLVNLGEGGEIAGVHVALKFSCPQGIGDEVSSLRPKVLVERLQDRYGERLKQIRTGRKLEIHHTVETLDRVAM